MRKLLSILILINLIILSFPYVPPWVFKSSAIDLLDNSDLSYETAPSYTILHGRLAYRLNKKIIKNSDNIEITNIMQAYFTDNPNNPVINENVDFEELESAYTDVNGRYYVCPKGSHHIYFRDDKLAEPKLYSVIPTDFTDGGEWELKCFSQFHREILFIFYLNKEEYIYKVAYGGKSIEKVGNKKYKILDFRWDTEYEGNIFPMYAFVEKENKAYMVQLNFKMDSLTIEEEEEESVYLFDFPNKNHWALLNNEQSHSKFYYFSYDNDSLHLNSGYSEDLETISSIKNISMNHNTTSPLEFHYNPYIKDIKFIPYTKYAYYTIMTSNGNSKYYGIIDLEINMVIFHTGETIKTFIPLTQYSMLAITKDSAYEICVVSSEGKCVPYCSDNTKIVYNVNKNECLSNTACPVLKLLPNNICVNQNSCDSNFFYFNYSDNTVSLCRDLGIGKPYKMMAKNVCLPTKIDNSKYVNSVNEDLKIIICNDGLSFVDDEECVLTDCFINCRTCSEKSNNKTDQHCLKCQTAFKILFEGNCMTDCPEKYYNNPPTCEACTLNCKICDANGCKTCYDGFYLNEQNTCSECHKNCETCEQGGTDENNNCKSCSKNYQLVNNNCERICGEKQFYSGTSCQDCRALCETCDNAQECTSCDDRHYFKDSYCYSCHKNCHSCSNGGNDTNNNCITCADNHYLVNGGDFENNCVTECPENYVFEVVNKTCNYVKPSNTSDKNYKENSNSSLLIWLFIVFAGLLLILINIIFCTRVCCGKDKDDDIVENIQTELTDTNLAIN